jgi:hypothetical protein
MVRVYHGEKGEDLAHRNMGRGLAGTLLRCLLVIGNVNKAARLTSP